MNRRTFLQQASGTLLALGSSALPASPQTSATHVFYDPATLRHEPGGDHPENPKRLDAVMESVRALESQGRVTVVGAACGNRGRDPARPYAALSEAGSRGSRCGTSNAQHRRYGALLRIAGAAMAAAGTVVSAVDAVMSGRARNAFCAVRPPGHHASQARGMGFCVFNNLAIGARHAARAYGVERVLIADWDVHHGNGTQEVFWSDGSVLFFDTHQHPWYPGTGSPDETGEGKGRGRSSTGRSRPAPAATRFSARFAPELVPAAERFKPELVMISAGFDSRAGDPLGKFTLDDADFAELTTLVVEIARQHARGRVVSVLEGGYSRDGLARAVAAHLDRLSA